MSKKRNIIAEQVEDIEVEDETKYDDFFFEEDCCKTKCPICEEEIV